LQQAQGPEHVVEGEPTPKALKARPRLWLRYGASRLAGRFDASHKIMKRLRFRIATRHTLTFWLWIVPVVHAEKETSVADTINRKLPAYQAQYAKIAPGLGRIMVVDAKYWGGLPVSVAIEREYVAVRKLPEPVRAEFFFILATKIPFDGHFLEEFVEMISRDCPAAFERRLKVFLDEFGQATAYDEVRRANTFLRSVRERAPKR